MDTERRFELPPDVQLEQQWQESGFLFHFGSEQGLPSDVDIEVRVLDADAEQGGAPRQTFFVIGGAGEDLDVMKPFLLSMARQEGVQVVGVSMPSYGDSSDADHRWRANEDGSDKTDFTDYTALIHSVHTHLLSDSRPGSVRSPSKKIDIVGHSLGGSMVGDFASRRPEDVSSVHLVAPAGMEKRYTLPGLRLPPFLFIEFVAAHFKERLPKVFDYIRGEELPPVIKNLWGKSFTVDGGAINSINDLERGSVEPRMIQRFWEGKVASQGKLPEQIGVMKERGIPVTVYASENDQLFPPSHYDMLKQREIPVITIPNAAHYGILDHSDVFVKHIYTTSHQTTHV